IALREPERSERSGAWSSPSDEPDAGAPKAQIAKEAEATCGWEAGTRTPKELPTYGKPCQRRAIAIPGNLNESGLPLEPVRSGVFADVGKSWRNVAPNCQRCGHTRHVH